MLLHPCPSATAPLLVLCITSWAVQATAGTLFPAHSDHPTGQTSIGVAVGEFNGDANPDLVVANVNSGGVAVLLGDGSGGVASSHSLVTGSAPRKIVTGDWDRDGVTDLAVVVGESHPLAVHRGNGDGSFGEPTFHGPAFSSSSDLATGDLNGDGFADIVVSAISVLILLGRADGGFVLGESAGPGGGSIVTSDLNGDAILDLAMSNRGNSTAAVLLGRGDGTFHPNLGSTSPWGASRSRLASAISTGTATRIW